MHKEKMLEALQPRRDELCKDCQQRLEKNPLRIFDCKNDRCQLVLKESGAPTILQALCDDCSGHFDGVKSYLAELGVDHEIDPKLVRGLDYYSRTAWEIIVAGVGTVSGGGRYNGLVEQLGGPTTAGIGFAGGVERALLALDAQGFEWPQMHPVDVFVAVAEAAADTAAMRFLQAVRNAGFIADRDYTGRSVKAQFKAADRMQARFVAVFGGTELEHGTVTLKELETGTQQEFSFSEALEHLTNRPGNPALSS